MRLDDGREALWEGFYTGPLVLDRGVIAGVAERWLGVPLDEVAAASERELRPFVSDEPPRRSLVIHSATPVLKFLEADLKDAMNNRPPDDVATYIETRAVNLARSGDLVVGRTAPWRAAAQLEGIEAVTVPGIDYYYLSHALLRLLADHGPDAPPVRRLVQALRERPETVVRLYSLDSEMQVVLLCLKRFARLSVLYTDANDPEVGEYWNTKAPLHPTLEDAQRLTASVTDPMDLLEAESALAPLSRRLETSFAALPGYVLSGARIAQELPEAGRLLIDRYGITVGCFKPSQGGAGARIFPGVPLDDEAELERLAAEAKVDEEYVLEAQVDYLAKDLAGVTVLAPSLHVRNGRVAEGLTLQMTRGTSWQGNVYFDRESWQQLGLLARYYDEMSAAVEALLAAFRRSGLTLATGGIDFALGRVGGTLGDRVLVAIQDPNLSAHGAEYLRHYLDDVRASGGPRHGATHVIRPTRQASLELLRSEVSTASAERRFKVLASVPGRWGLIAAAAETPEAALMELLARERELEKAGLLAG